MVALEAGAVIAGRYRLERPLAKGGMGSVWLARHLPLDLEVAIKFMAPEHAASSDLRARFEREAKACARLKLQNVVQVHDYGVEADTPYLAMELLEGEDLDGRLVRERRLTPAATLAIVEPICKALGHAHEVGLVHRDLKPRNIFLARQGGEEVVKILDFGIAKDTALRLVDNMTKTGTMLGSPAYMSPEQVRRRKEIDHRSDLWSLGVIAFQCLTGQLPFQSDDIGEILVAICSDDCPPASRIVPDLAPMDHFLMRALAREPRERFQNAQAFAHAFRAAVSAAERPPESEIGTLPSLEVARARPRGRARAVGLALALFGAAAALGFIAYKTLRSSAPDAAATTASEPAAPPSAAAPAPEQPAPAESASTPEPPDTSAPAPSLQNPAHRRAPAPIKPRKPGNDPLDKF